MTARKNHGAMEWVPACEEKSSIKFGLLPLKGDKSKWHSTQMFFNSLLTIFIQSSFRKSASCPRYLFKVTDPSFSALFQLRWGGLGIATFSEDSFGRSSFPRSIVGTFKRAVCMLIPWQLGVSVYTRSLIDSLHWFCSHLPSEKFRWSDVSLVESQNTSSQFFCCLAKVYCRASSY